MSNVHFNKHRVVHLTTDLPISPVTLELFQIKPRQIIKPHGISQQGAGGEAEW